MSLLQTLGASLRRVLSAGEGGVGSRFRRLVRVAYVIFSLFLVTELAIIAFGVSLPGLLRTAVHTLAAVSLIVAIGIGAAYYVTAGSVWPSAT